MAEPTPDPVVRAPENEPARSRRRLTRRDIRRLTFLLGTLACVVLVLLSGWIAYSALQSEIDARLRSAGAGTNAGLVSIEAEQLSLLREISFTSGLGAALTKQDAASLNRLVTPLQANSEVPMVDLVLPDGQVIFAVRSAGAPAPVANRKGILAIIATSLKQVHGARNGRRSLLVTLQGSPTLLTIGPVLDDNTPAGVALVMTPLADVLGRLATEAGAALTTYDRAGAPTATTSSRTTPAISATRSSAVFATGDVLFRDDPRNTREAVGRLIIDHEPEALLGVLVGDDALATEVFVDIVAAGILVLGLCACWLLWRRAARSSRAVD